MKTTTALMACLLVCAVRAQLPGNSKALNTRLQPKYLLESAIVEYQVTGDASGTARLYLDRNGWRTAKIRDLTLRMYGVETRENTLELTDGDHVATVNLNTRKGKQAVDKKWSSMMAYKAHQEVLQALMESGGGKTDSTETILGRKCQVWTFEKGTTRALSEWSGLPLRIVKELPGIRYELTATSIRREAVPDSVWILPEGIVWD